MIPTNFLLNFAVVFVKIREFFRQPAQGAFPAAAQKTAGSDFRPTPDILLFCFN